MKRNITLLAICQALFMTSGTLLVSTSALVGLSLAPEPLLATVPLGAQFFSTMATSMPASLLMRRVGRRAGFMIGASVGIGGAVSATLAILAQDFALFVVGSSLLGIYNGCCQLYRFAAADAATDEYRSRAISLVLTGGLVAAFTGPGLAYATRELMSPVFAASYASLTILYAASLGLLYFTRIPWQRDVQTGSAGRPLWAIAKQPAFLMAVVCAMIGYGSMNVLMTSTPLAMNDSGFAFGHTAVVIQWHVLGMFAPSFVTGHLIARYGVGRVIAAGAILIGTCAAVNLAGTGMLNYWLALLLLGVGWNFMFIGATTLLTWTCYPSEKAKSQGLNDLLVFGTVALTATSSGMLYGWLGWVALNSIILPLIAVAVLICAFTRVDSAAAPGLSAGGLTEEAAKPR
jgi:predicted MFS family arabinose efflux permease